MSIPAESAHSPQKGLPRMRISSRRLAVWVSLVLICVAAVSALLLVSGIDGQLRDVTKTHSVRTAARELTYALSQAEAGQRGYLLTQDNQFLDPYNQAVSSINQRVGMLLNMTADDIGQAERMRSILGDIAGKMAEMERTVELVGSGREDIAQSLTETGMGVRLMSEVSKTLEDFIGQEDEKLAARNEAIDRSRLGLAIALIAALVAAAILAYALLSRTQRQVSVLAQQQLGLRTQNEALEALIAERTRDIEDARAHAERERQRVEALLQDTNHRIGNSLATVSSLLALQMMRTSSDAVRNALEAARLRVHAIASAHRRLRLGQDLETASADEFLQAVLDDIALTQTDKQRITINGEIAEIEVASRDATTLGILVGELVTNALKHGFPDGKAGEINVRLFRDGQDVPTLQVSDNGGGVETLEPQSEGGLGSMIVQQLSAPFGGKPVYSRGAPSGLTVTIALPKLGQPTPSRSEN